MEAEAQEVHPIKIKLEKGFRLKWMLMTKKIIIIIKINKKENSQKLKKINNLKIEFLIHKLIA